MDKRASDILALLKAHQPAFQLQSGTSELASSEAYFTERGRDTAAIARASYASSEAVLQFIAETIEPHWVTLETGGGRSTCVFAALARQHVCINPDVTANQLVHQFLASHGLPGNAVQFVPEPSDLALPGLSKDLMVDLALIDGNHSFPLPIIDWHYIDRHLRRGGLLLVDDTQIRSVRVLTDFLSSEASYAFERAIGTTSVWRRVLERRTWGWAAQPMNQSGAPGLERLIGAGLRVMKRVGRMAGVSREGG
jgi:predicted O-methyltransferase YrrM